MAFLKNNKQFAGSMIPLKRTAWDIFITVINNFLDKKKSVNYNDLVATILKAFQKLGCNMSIIFCLVTWTYSLITLVAEVTNKVTNSTKT